MELPADPSLRVASCQQQETYDAHQAPRLVNNSPIMPSNQKDSTSSTEDSVSKTHDKKDTDPGLQWLWEAANHDEPPRPASKKPLNSGIAPRGDWMEETGKHV